MTIAVLNNDGAQPAQVGPDKSILPTYDDSVKWIAGNTMSKEIDIRGFRGVALIALPTSALAGATAIRIMVSTKKGGIYVPLPNVADIVLDGSNNTPLATSWIAQWASMRFDIVGTLTGSGDMPFVLS